jgi:hypothetical protein
MPGFQLVAHIILEKNIKRVTNQNILSHGRADIFIELFENLNADNFQLQIQAKSKSFFS